MDNENVCERTDEEDNGLPCKQPASETFREIPAPLPLRRMFGPGLVMAGVGLASAEFILWPYLTSRVGPAFLWVAVIAVLTQLVVNLEVGRYTLATGKSVLNGFSRLWRPWGIVFAVLAVVANAWPAWAVGSATAIALAYDVGGEVILPISILSLVVIGLVLTLAPVAYRTLEGIQFLKAGVVLLFLGVSLVVGINAWDWQELPSATLAGFTRPSGVLEQAEMSGRLPEGLSTSTLVGLVAFAGAGGFLNLAQSYWIREKGLGMTIFHPGEDGRETEGERFSTSPARYTFLQDEENLARWHTWWRNFNREQFIGFFVVGAVAIVIFSMLAYATLYDLEVGPDFDYVLVQGAVLSGTIGPWFGTSFWVVGAVSLLAANLGIVDYTSRLSADALKSGFLSESGFWSEGRIYTATVWGMVSFGCLVLLFASVGAVELILLSATLGVLAMSVYCTLLIPLNRKTLPTAIRLKGFRLGTTIWAALLFSALTLLLVLDILTRLLAYLSSPN